jgi:hypothetical protein
MGLLGHEQVLVLTLTVLVVTARARTQLSVLQKLELPSVIRSLFTGLKSDEVSDSDVVTVVLLY